MPSAAAMPSDAIALPPVRTTTTKLGPGLMWRRCKGTSYGKNGCERCRGRTLSRP